MMTQTQQIDIDLEKVAILEQEQKLADNKTNADKALDEAAEAVDAATRKYQSWLKRYQDCGIAQRQLGEDITEKQRNLTEAILDSNGINTEPYKALDEMQAELARLRLFGDLLATEFLKTAEHDMQRAEAVRILREGEQAMALVAIREHHIKLALSGIVAQEGELTIEDGGVTAELRRHGAALRAQGLMQLKNLGEKN